MTTRAILVFGGAIAVIYGIGFLLSPDLLGQLYGFKATASVTLAYRYFGVALLGLGLLCWALRDLRDALVLRNVLGALAVSDAAGIAVSAWGASYGIINGLGWLNVAIYALLLLGTLYLLRDLSVSSRVLPA